MVSIVLAGGGTAGHTSPLIATAQALRVIDPTCTITCVGTAKGLETRVIPEAGYPLELVPAVPLPRKLSVDLLKLPFRMASAVSQAKRILTRVDADVVVGFGGYASLPAYLAARAMKVPVVVQEQNVLPGLANKVAARFASAVLTSFADTPLPGARCEGMPLRQAIADLAAAGRTTEQRAAKESYGLNPDLPVVLVSGGSQGARSVNTAVSDATSTLLAKGIQVLHVWGPKNFHDGLAATTDDSGAVYMPLSYVDDMDRAYAAADLMIARSGAGTVAETASIGLPTILVPLAIGNGEQARNAAGVVEAGAAVLIPDDQISGEVLAGQVIELVETPGKLEHMSEQGPTVIAPGAAARVARIVMDIATGEEG